MEEYLEDCAKIYIKRKKVEEKNKVKWKNGEKLNINYLLDVGF